MNRIEHLVNVNSTTQIKQIIVKLTNISIDFLLVLVGNIRKISQKLRNCVIYYKFLQVTA